MAKRQKQENLKGGFNRKLLYSIVLVTIVLLAVIVVYYSFFFSYRVIWTAAIVDQLTIEGKSLFNQDFNTTITTLLTASGFDVKYYPGEDVTVDYYKDLPSKAGKIIILRAHSSVRNESDYVDLFTSEPYSRSREIQYSAEYGTQLSIAEFLFYPYNRYFAIGPTFVDFSMRGKFDSDCLIILMGCNSFNKTTMAEALVSRGAKVIVGWTDWVELDDTDSSTIQLLQYLFAAEPYTVRGAVGKINESPHPWGEMDYYPKEAGSYIVPTRKNEISSSLTVELFQFLLLANLPNWNLNRVDSFSNCAGD